MTNKFIITIILIVLNFSLSKLALAEEFIFEVSSLEITNNGEVYKGKNRGKIIANTQLELISDNFEYLKKKIILRQMGMFSLMILRII